MRAADDRGVTDLSDLVHRWDERLRRDLSPFERLAPEAEARGSLLREPASEASIEEAEHRLGTVLPPSYRAFLRVSNGAYASSLGPEEQGWGTVHRNGFLRIEQVHRMDADEWGSRTIQLWTEIAIFTDPTREVRPIGDELVEVQYMSPMRDAIVISARTQTLLDVLVPRNDGREAELWSLGHSGHSAYRSFDALLRNMVARPSARPREEDRDHYVELARGGRNTIEALLELEDPRAIPIALAHLRDPAVKEVAKSGWVRALGLTRDPALVEDLRELYANPLTAALGVEILYARLMCRDPDVRTDLVAAAAGTTGRAPNWADFALTQLDKYGPP